MPAASQKSVAPCCLPFALWSNISPAFHRQAGAPGMGNENRKDGL